MAIYDQNIQNGTGAPWYAPQQTPQNYYKPTSAVPGQPPQSINQFIWVNGQGTVDMWPVAAGSEMTFIDNENMMLYVKRVDEFGHPFRTRMFKLTELPEKNETEKTPEPAVNMEELKSFLSAEIDKAVSAKLKDMFTIKTAESVGVSNA